MSIVAYNRVTLPYSNATFFDASPVFDDVGGVDHCLTRYTVQVQCYITGDFLAMYANTKLSQAGAANDPTARNPAMIMQLIQARLEQPRQTLSYTFNGIELIPQKQQVGAATIAGSVDARNGPQTSVQVIQLTNETFILRFGVVAHYWRNNRTQLLNNHISNANNRGADVIYNRWMETVSLDGSMYSTRTRVGRYMIRSDNASGLTADDYREGFACCSLPKGFLRVSSQYDLTPDGLGCQYRIVDQEVFKMPPAPAFEARGKYIDTTTRNGAYRLGEVNLMLRAPKTVDQVLLINVALGVAAKKLITSGALGQDGKNPVSPTNKGFGRLEHCIIAVDMYDNMVEVSMRAMMTNSQITEEGSNKRKWGIAGIRGGKALAVTPAPELANPTATGQPPYSTRGTASLLLNAAAYYDPSLTTDSVKLKIGKIWSSRNANVSLSTDGQAADQVQTRGVDGIVPGQAGTTSEPPRE